MSVTLIVKFRLLNIYINVGTSTSASSSFFSYLLKLKIPCSVHRSYDPFLVEVVFHFVFSGGSRLQFSLPSSTQRHQRHSSAGPAPSRIRSVRSAQSSSPPYVSPRLESPLRHSPSIPPQVQLQASASDVCKPGVRGAPQLTRVLDLEFFQLSRLCSPHVSSITSVAVLPTPLTAPLSSSQPYQLNIAASLLRRDSSQFIGFFDRGRLSHFVHEMDYFHFAVSLTSPIKIQGSHLFLAVSQPTLMSAFPPILWRCLSISITVLLSCGAVRSGPEDAAGFVSTSFRGAD
ncbi:hypothetical protein F2Q70_00033126 [Brassica cretica]|uniref:Uncharacterized protein n=1 Tax=Brassica cretica TaxID=69181 RepID=A0A8S9FHN5_BRACR|nr:hypothetical protein F2Q70_00033126 [Brassica cretica]KAF2554118.1 hypothetical protein F2Q68_00037464 [Brassica cretica]